MGLTQLWRHYRQTALTGDLMAAPVVAALLVPQGLAYAQLAGLPAEYGLYAGLLPPALYALAGSSRYLAVGPVAGTSLLAFAALSAHAVPGSAEYLQWGMALALIYAVLLALFGLLNFTWLADLLSKPVASAYLSAMAVLIVLSQSGTLLGLTVRGLDIPAWLNSLWPQLGQQHSPTMLVGSLSLVAMLALKYGLPALLARSPWHWAAGFVNRTAPAWVLIILGVLSTYLGWGSLGVALVGEVPHGLPQLITSLPDQHQIATLLLPGMMLVLVGYMESLSVAQKLGARRQEKVNPRREFFALALANASAAFTAAMPVTGGVTRSAVNYDSGARSRLAGLMVAVLTGAVLLGLTGLISPIPRATLAAIIVVSVVTLVDLESLKSAWRYDRRDAMGWLVTFVGVLWLGVLAGLLLGIAVALALFIAGTSQPHMAVVGRLGGTEHYRNVDRHAVLCEPGVLAVRIDESLYFANSRPVEAWLLARVNSALDPVRDVLLIFSAVNRVDVTGLLMLQALNSQLKSQGIRLNLAEVKGPVMDRLKQSHLLADLTGKVYLSTHEGMQSLAATTTDYVI